MLKLIRARPDLFHQGHLDLPREEYIALNFKRMQYIVQECKAFDAHRLEHHYLNHMARLEGLGTFDPCLSVKISLQFNFTIGGLINLGSERHRPLVKRVETMELVRMIF